MALSRFSMSSAPNGVIVIISILGFMTCDLVKRHAHRFMSATLSCAQPPWNCRQVAGDDALDFNERVDTREQQLLRIAQLGIAWLDQVSTSTGMRRFLRSAVSKQNWVRSELRSLYAA